jgi:hypothetical protein
MDALNAWRNATMLKPEHSLAWNNMIILLDNTGAAGELIDQRRLIHRTVLLIIRKAGLLCFPHPIYIYVYGVKYFVLQKCLF